MEYSLAFAFLIMLVDSRCGAEFMQRGVTEDRLSTVEGQIVGIIADSNSVQDRTTAVEEKVNNVQNELTAFKNQEPPTRIFLDNSGSSSANKGLIYIIRDGIIGTVCDDLWDNNDCKVVCRELGYSHGITKDSQSSNQPYGRGVGKIWMDNVQCTGSEARLADCPFNGWGVNNCHHGEDTGCTCS